MLDTDTPSPLRGPHMQKSSYSWSVRVVSPPTSVMPRHMYSEICFPVINRTIMQYHHSWCDRGWNSEREFELEAFAGLESEAGVYLSLIHI